MNGQRESLDHVSPVENQGDHPEFLRWLLVGGAMVAANERRGQYD